MHLVLSQGYPQVLFTLLQSQTLNGVGRGAGGQSPPSLAPQHPRQPAVASNSWIDTPGCTVPRSLPGLGSWGSQGGSRPRQVPGRVVWRPLRLQAGAGGGEKGGPGALSLHRSHKSSPGGHWGSQEITLMQE